MAIIYKEIEVDIDEFETSDLIEELEHRNHLPSNSDHKALLEQIWMKRRTGNQDYQKDLDDLIWLVLGRIV